ncbi:MAG: prenyltransferase/squalene oxidase repeat-containing protein [Candidatus Methanomethyliaceae archaeon]
MGEAGRLALFKSGHFKNLVAKRVIDYVVSQQNDDGGYAFCYGVDSNAQDTYYGLAILDLLGAPFPNFEKTVDWLRCFRPDGLYSHYYVAKALELCDLDPKMEKKSLKKFVLSLPFFKGEFENIDFNAEGPSKFLSVFMGIELANMIDIEADSGEKIKGWIFSFKNNDGGFGASGHSDLNSTYHAVASLFNLGYQVTSLKDTLEYIRSCEKPYGGFTIVPDSSTHFVEDVYYGTSALRLFGESLRFPWQTAEFVLRCQNANGGFARSEIGISTFEDTFYAVSVLKTISEQW